MNVIPSFNLTEQYKLISEEISEVSLEILTSGQYIGGDTVKQFEQQFAGYIGSDHCVACNSGTDALFLALRSLGIGAGDEVITTPFTFVSTAEVICALGAVPVFVDIEPQTFNLDLSQVEAALTKRTKAIIPVHLFGNPVNMTPLMTLAQAHRLWVIEDCAQATGAKWDGQPVGSIGHLGCFSFYPTKNLGACGDGGAITTNDVALADRLRMLRDHGQRQRYVYEEIGVNSRLDALQAGILQVKLRYLETWNQQRQTIAHQYQQWLSPLPGIILPQEIEGGESVWNQYTVRVLTPEGAENQRDRVKQQLQKHGVGSTIYYPIPLHLQPIYATLGYQAGQLPIAEQVAQEVLSLPMFPELTIEQQQQVVYALKESMVKT
ncbi:DegT/DnrJ/EryC1/StrS family aminotransferase [Thermocoleostomius sinensis]|uniref:DegT/DnrJ/EryC1/StrS family aminotransferase n=1 Tax=Thermocoleostomius sinensis A174 TaxID=2016057 RepID=A0A9E8Z8T9_9CYAN|nr:DegT/DnrJ/EryC1/StrS family aminotransferase [Thermocoleostomius sinensis]WAL58618.1 DegT/DnrJ/EryC1/StrS family aminotransferase [Thermocoleostomius sinensis A174]